MELFVFVVMDKVRLRVKTVPVTDLLTHEMFTVYTVINDTGHGDGMQCSSGFTLRDAISSFCDYFQITRIAVELVRPFLPQGWNEDVLN